MINCLVNLFTENESGEIRVIRMICIALSVLGSLIIASLMHVNFLVVFVCTCIVWDGISKLLEDYMV